MIKTRLIGQVPSSKKYIALTVLAQWIRLCANIVMMFIFSHILELILGGATMTVSVLLPYIIGISAVMAVRYMRSVQLKDIFFGVGTGEKSPARENVQKAYPHGCVVS